MEAASSSSQSLIKRNAPDILGGGARFRGISLVTLMSSSLDSSDRLGISLFGTRSNRGLALAHLEFYENKLHRARLGDGEVLVIPGYSHSKEMLNRSKVGDFEESCGLTC